MHRVLVDGTAARLAEHRVRRFDAGQAGALQKEGRCRMPDPVSGTEQIIPGCFDPKIFFLWPNRRKCMCFGVSLQMLADAMSLQLGPGLLHILNRFCQEHGIRLRQRLRRTVHMNFERAAVRLTRPTPIGIIDTV